MHSGYHSSGMVISGTCTTEYETGSDDSLGVNGDNEVEGSTGVGLILLFLVTGPLEVTVTSCTSSSVTPSMGTAPGGGAGGIQVKAFGAVMRGGAGITLPTGCSEEDGKSDANTSMQLATGVPSIATSSCCMASACS